MKPLGVTLTDLTRLETTEALQHAVDNNFQRVIETARHKWEQKFAGQDPTDACVKVEVVPAETPVEAKSVPRCGFLKLQRDFKQRSNISLPRYAH